MANLYRKHYTVQEAESLLPQINGWLDSLRSSQTEFSRLEDKLAAMGESGEDRGGALVNRYYHTLADLRATLFQFQQRDIQIKDLERGLIDFPSFRGTKEVFLCWEQGEESIEFWHDLDSGYAGREPL